MHNTERVDKLASLLDAMHKLTGLDYTGRTFNSRFTIQKTVYLLKTLGNPTAMQYDFSTYIRGPYSKDLADDYYAVAKLRPEPKVRANVPAGDVEIIRSAFARGELFVEALATMHSVRRSNPGITREEVINHVRAIKPHLSGKTLDEAWGFLYETGLAK
jgi:uncharacterized protein YwgA